MRYRSRDLKAQAFLIDDAASVRRLIDAIGSTGVLNTPDYLWIERNGKPCIVPHGFYAVVLWNGDVVAMPQTTLSALFVEDDSDGAG